MKNILLAVAIICSNLSVFASTEIDVVGRGLIASTNYQIVSDEFNGAIPKGKCLVVGHVYWQDNTYSNIKDKPLVDGTLATLDREKSYLTDTSGQFKLLLDVGDTSLFFYKPGYEEIVIWNYNFKSQHVVTIDFYPVYNAIVVTAKPVIYLYSENEIDAKVQFESKGAVTFTYPEYTDEWNVNVNQNKITDTKSGKTYPYLFWDGTSTNLDFKLTNSNKNIHQMEGFLISRDTLVRFLENSLTALGLNTTEQTDFITFWAPKMIAKEFVLVQFLEDESYANFVSTLSIWPQPDALKRIYMIFKPLDNLEVNFEIFPQELHSFERKGFTAVEWGGSELPASRIIP